MMILSSQADDFMSAFSRSTSRLRALLVLLALALLSLIAFWKVSSPDSLPSATSTSLDAESSCSSLRNELQKCQEASSQRGALCPSGSAEPAPLKPALLVLCYNRPDYLRRTLESVLRFIPPTMPLFISQDGNEEAVTAEIRRHQRRAFHLHNFPRAPPDVPGSSYSYLAQHYRFALELLFDRFHYDSVIILEDDMEIAPDFFSYMEAAARVLQKDGTLYCASAWNDQGKSSLVSNAKELRRTDVFPGLGWLFTAALWKEIGPRWPKNYWDEWMRSPEQRRGRQCVYPEISRSYTFGRSGVSMGQFFDDHLAPIKLNSEIIRWNEEDLTYLDPELYGSALKASVASAVVVQEPATLLNTAQSDKSYVCYYTSEWEFDNIARSLSLMPGFKEGSPRSSFMGIVKVRLGGKVVVYIAPKN